MPELCVGVCTHLVAYADEEFNHTAADIAFKKSHRDIMTREELWQWARPPLRALPAFVRWSPA